MLPLVFLLASALSGQVAAPASPTATAPPAGNDQAPEFTIRSTVNRVLLDVSVRNPAGGLVSGLRKDNFHVFDDGKEQPIIDFAAGDIPVTVGIVVDESFSMAPKRPEVLTAALTFAKESNPRDEMFVVNFNETATHGLPDDVLFTDNLQMLRQALMRGKPEGRTALYDAVVTALKQLDMGREAKKTLVLISDGGDNVSRYSLRDVMRLTQETSATIYTIGVFDSDDPDRNPGILKGLAQVSGGIAYFPQKLDEIVPICQKIAKDIRSRYTLSYQPPQGNGREQLRRVRVEVTAPDIGKLIARTRTSYMYLPNGTEDADAFLPHGKNRKKQ